MLFILSLVDQYIPKVSMRNLKILKYFLNEWFFKTFATTYFHNIMFQYMLWDIYDIFRIESISFPEDWLQVQNFKLALFTIKECENFKTFSIF